MSETPTNEDLLDLLDTLNRKAWEWVRHERRLMSATPTSKSFDTLKHKANEAMDEYGNACTTLRRAIRAGESA